MIDTPDSMKRFAAAIADRYTLKRELGRGGMAIVYLAEDIKHQRHVAIKIFQPELAGNVGHERFLREIRVAANLTHPHILALYDSGEAEGLLYYVMPYIQGETLRDRLHRLSQLTLDEAVRICAETAGALGYAHRQGLVHRDIKPENLMLTGEHTLVMDFGICGAIGEARSESGLTRAGTVVGTPAYMSPEQWTAPERVSERSDIYSLGCVLYEMLVGEPPFTGATTAVILARHTQQDMPSLRVVRPDIPETVEALLRRALAKLPEERYQTALEFSEALNTAAHQPTVPLAVATPPTVTAPPQGTITFRLPVRRKPLAVILVIAALVMTGVVFALTNRGGTAPAAAIALTTSRVVVGLFENRTGDSTYDDLGRMAGDWITEGLHRTGVEVVPSVTALQAAEFVRADTSPGRVRDPIRALALETRAGLVIYGSYSMEGDSIQFLLQMSDATTDTTRLVGALDPVLGSPRAPAEMIKAVRNRVMGQLALDGDERIAAGAAAAEQPPDFEAYRAFSHGLDSYINNRNRAALTDFYRAFELDSTFTVTLLYAAFAHSNLGELARVDSLTQRIALRRRELTDYNRSWLEYLEARVKGQNMRALTAIRRADEIAPGSKAAYNRAFIAHLTNRPKEAVDALETLDPERGAMRGWMPYWETLTDSRHRLGDHEEELAAAQRARVLFPDRAEPPRWELEALGALGRTSDIERLITAMETVPIEDLTVGEAVVAAAHELRSHGHAAEASEWFDRALQWYRARPAAEAASEGNRSALAGVLHATGRWSEARQIVDDLAKQYPDAIGYRAWGAILAAGAGDRDAALRTDQWLGTQVRPYSFGFETYQRARIAAILNDRARAVELVREAFAQGFKVPRHRDINFENLRDHQPFTDLYEPGG